MNFSKTNVEIFLKLQTIHKSKVKAYRAINLKCKLSFLNIRVYEGTQDTPGTSPTHAYAVLNKPSW
jgi:hypothetical protein